MGEGHLDSGAGSDSVAVYEPDFAWIDGAFRPGLAVVVRGGWITGTGPADELVRANPGARRVPLRGEVLLPGTVNAHNHSFQSLLRGIAVDEPFLAWRDKALYAHTPFLDPETLYAGALLAFGEMLLYGATSVADFFYVHGGGLDNDLAVIRAAEDLGIRLVFARTMYDWGGAPEAYRETVEDAVRRTRDLAARFSGHPLVTVHPAPHSPHGASAEMIRAGHRLARELGTPFHIHVAEEPFEVEEILGSHGVRPVHYLDRLGVLDDSMIAVHLVWLAPDEIELLGQRRASLAYCPSSNMFLADGVTDLPGLIKAGVRVSLGTDGGCSNNRVSVFEEMRMAALLQKVHRLDATAVASRETFDMGTRRGAEALRIPAGRIAAGHVADMVAVDTGDLSLHPFSADLLLAHLVYSMQPSAVRRVYVHGKEVARDGELLTVPKARIARLVGEAASRWKKG